MALKRVDLDGQQDNILGPLIQQSTEGKLTCCPIPSGAPGNAEEAIYAARLAREALGTHFVKIEIHPDPKYPVARPH